MITENIYSLRYYIIIDLYYIFLEISFLINFISNYFIVLDMQYQKASRHLKLDDLGYIYIFIDLNIYIFFSKKINFFTVKKSRFCALLYEKPSGTRRYFFL